MERLMEILRSGNHSLVVAGSEIRTFDGRGIADLYRIFTLEPDFLAGASVADKVVGKGAAALMVLGGVKEVYAGVASSAALTLLHNSGIAVRCDLEVPHIINRKGDGICPVETLCGDCTTAAECLPRIEQFMQQLKQQNDASN